MRFKQVQEAKVEIPPCALLSLEKRASQSKILFREKKDREKKIVRMRAELTRYQRRFEEVNAARGVAAGQDGTAMDAEMLFQALVSIETRLRVFNTSRLLEPQVEWIKATRRIALDALGKLEKEGK